MIISPDVLIAFILCLGAVLVYMRFVAKEIDRRERYLQKRLEDKIKEWQEKRNRRADPDKAESGSDDRATVEVMAPEQAAQSQAA
jgi:hypothetical protein